MSKIGLGLKRSRPISNISNAIQNDSPIKKDSEDTLLIEKFSALEIESAITFLRNENNVSLTKVGIPIPIVLISQLIDLLGTPIDWRLALIHSIRSANIVICDSPLICYGDIRILVLTQDLIQLANTYISDKIIVQVYEKLIQHIAVSNGTRFDISDVFDIYNSVINDPLSGKKHYDKKCENIISILLSQGFIRITSRIGEVQHINIQKTSTAFSPSQLESYTFTIPFAGQFWSNLQMGRKELLSRIKRRLRKEIPRIEAEKIQLHKSKLSTLFHIRDAVGSKLLDCITVNNIKLLRIPTS